LKKIAETMPGSSGEEVKGVCTEAGMYALRERRVHVVISSKSHQQVIKIFVLPCLS
jgi:ATP-dependent 26S proteasome regulatory subunit